MTSDRKLLIKILYLHCFVTDEMGFDELYLTWNGKRIWPDDHKFSRVKKGRTDINVEITHLGMGSRLELELWDYDYVSANDFLGRITVIADEPGGPYTTDMVPNKTETRKAKYALEWEIDFQ